MGDTALGRPDLPTALETRRRPAEDAPAEPSGSDLKDLSLRAALHGQMSGSAPNVEFSDRSPELCKKHSHLCFLGHIIYL